MKSAAHLMADELRSTYESKGFKEIFWPQYQREIRQVERWVQTTPTTGNVSQVAIELARRQGFLEGVRALERMAMELQVVLDEGRIPWLNKR